MCYNIFDVNVNRQKGDRDMKKKKIITLLTILAVCISFTSCFDGNTYSSAKKECSKILEKYQVQMEDIALNSLDSKADISGYFNKYYYSYYQDQGFVKFDINAQGMLGGQYWGLVYTDNGLLYDEEETYYFEEEDGNNIIRAEKIKGNWWFYWEDYDGTDNSQK